MAGAPDRVRVYLTGCALRYDGGREDGPLYCDICEDDPDLREQRLRDEAPPVHGCAEDLAGQGEPHLGYLFRNPDTGTEWSENHPVESGECDDAEEVRPATLIALREELFSAWEDAAEQRQERDRAAPDPAGQGEPVAWAVEAASAAYYDGMTGTAEERWPHHTGWAGKTEAFKSKVRTHMARALLAAARISNSRSLGESDERREDQG